MLALFAVEATNARCRRWSDNVRSLQLKVLFKVRSECQKPIGQFVRGVDGFLITYRVSVEENLNPLHSTSTVAVEQGFVETTFFRTKSRYGITQYISDGTFPNNLQAVVQSRVNPKIQRASFPRAGARARTARAAVRSRGVEEINFKINYY
ncbi:hypothetical protein EVAR_86733_1 [Eumeta japonica]|uniref:Uncharacterized protein n=1 Tax=Eumeta variegata TaxID=151549 RepID=A0A4C1W095_EUMVA|nr:hypothetical protein EVAR_86733_1 [Eumeta japonica]